VAKSLRLKLAVPLCWALGLTACSALALAAERDPLVVGIDAIPFEELTYVLPIILVGALLSTLIKMSKLDRPQFRSVPLEIAKDIVGSVCAGGLMFLGMLWVNKSLYEIDILGRFIAIFFASYGGSKLIEIAYEEGFTSWFKGLWSRVTGRVTQAAQPTNTPADGGN
jgi:hypothetical protein